MQYYIRKPQSYNSKKKAKITTVLKLPTFIKPQDKKKNFEGNQN